MSPRAPAVRTTKATTAAVRTLVPPGELAIGPKLLLVDRSVRRFRTVGRGAARLESNDREDSVRLPPTPNAAASEPGSTPSIRTHLRARSSPRQQIGACVRAARVPFGHSAGPAHAEPIACGARSGGQQNLSPCALRSPRPRSARQPRRVGPMRAGPFGLRAHVDGNRRRHRVSKRHLATGVRANGHMGRASAGPPVAAGRR
jgi:hypothetical protein